MTRGVRAAGSVDAAAPMAGSSDGPATGSPATGSPEPATDGTYIPCISLIDAWAPDGRVQLVVYAHSLDLGKKAYANFVDIAALQREIASSAGLPTGGLVIHVKTAHIYEPEIDAMAGLVGATAG